MSICRDKTEYLVFCQRNFLDFAIINKNNKRPVCPKKTKKPKNQVIKIKLFSPSQNYENISGGYALSDLGTTFPCHSIYQILKVIFSYLFSTTATVTFKFFFRGDCCQFFGIQAN